MWSEAPGWSATARWHWTHKRPSFSAAVETVGGSGDQGKGTMLPIIKRGFTILVLLVRSEEHTSELQSRPHLVCRLLLEKKKKQKKKKTTRRNSNTTQL